MNSIVNSIAYVKNTCCRSHTIFSLACSSQVLIEPSSLLSIPSSPPSLHPYHAPSSSSLPTPSYIRHLYVFLSISLPSRRYLPFTGVHPIPPYPHLSRTPFYIISIYRSIHLYLTPPTCFHPSLHPPPLCPSSGTFQDVLKILLTLTRHKCTLQVKTTKTQLLQPNATIDVDYCKCDGIRPAQTNETNFTLFTHDMEAMEQHLDSYLRRIRSACCNNRNTRR